METARGSRVSIGSATPAILMCILLFVLPQVAILNRLFPSLRNSNLFFLFSYYDAKNNTVQCSYFPFPITFCKQIYFSLAIFLKKTVQIKANGIFLILELQFLAFHTDEQVFQIFVFISVFLTRNCDFF